MKGRLIVISGPSGVGKGTICDIVMKNVNSEYSVSFTTRNPREGEINGIDYHFVDKNKFEEMINKGEFLEYNYYNDNYYGTAKSIVLDKINKGINVFLEIDVNGALNIKKLFNDALLIYIAPPSSEELRNRLINRGTESLEKIEDRLRIAKEEEKKTKFYDYVVINDKLDDSVKKILSILEKEGCC